MECNGVAAIVTGGASGLGAATARALAKAGAKVALFDRQLAAAETLGAGHDFLRVDFFEINGTPRFGEFCLYPGSGLDPFAEEWIDFELGALWHAARRDIATSEQCDAGRNPMMVRFSPHPVVN